MISVFKGVNKKETNYDHQELIDSCVNAVEPNQELWKAEPLPTIPETVEEKFSPIEIGSNGFRHDAMIFDLEADDYVIVICAAPNVSAVLIVLYRISDAAFESNNFHQQILGKN